MTSNRMTGAATAMLLLALGACETVDDEAPYEPNASMGMLIARDSCSSCHAVGGTGDSPNEDATAFREVVNRPGTTPEGLATWLRDAHNYPIEMGVHLEPHQVDSLVAYMMRLETGDHASAR
ncbi:cytochrome c [Aurantiacibacter sp. MUD11]|uniref:c-type cytochrome n=1 Tax=Aurantiacibacter sp. MUD11 TaxID=3003265 RepID=UPI0022AA1F12|nr:cytochrome c [Aurantiacibacter sp. MUD11]WAT18106.1 cytochrome c [Aurantiacibacter sp. MUD11]